MLIPVPQFFPQSITHTHTLHIQLMVSVFSVSIGILRDPTLLRQVGYVNDHHPHGTRLYLLQIQA